MGEAYITRRGGGKSPVPQGPPEYTYTGNHQLIGEGDGNWHLEFRTSGILTLASNVTIDAFLVGGGGSSGAETGPTWIYLGGAGSGYTATTKGITLAGNQPYTVTVGAGAATVSSGVGNTGGSTTAFNLTANGGKGGMRSNTTNASGGAGGSGGGHYNNLGGVDGAKGAGANGGEGQGATTRAFGDPSGVLYAKGGNGGGISGATAGATNTGNGGDATGTSNATSRAGGSGIVIIRNARN